MVYTLLYKHHKQQRCDYTFINHQFVNFIFRVTNLNFYKIKNVYIILHHNPECTPRREGGTYCSRQRYYLGKISKYKIMNIIRLVHSVLLALRCCAIIAHPSIVLKMCIFDTNGINIFFLLVIYEPLLTLTLVSCHPLYGRLYV